MTNSLSSMLKSTVVLEPMPEVETIRRKRAGVVDDQVGIAEVFQLMLRRPDEHGMHEERVIWPRANDANLDAIFWVPPRETVEAVKEVAGVEVIAGALANDGECVRIERDVHWTPPDIVFGGTLFTTRLSLGERPVLAPE